MSLLKFERTLFKEPPVFTKWERTTMLYICTCIDRSVGCKWVKEYISCYPASIFKKLIWFYSRKVHELPDSTAVVSWGGVAIKAFPLLKWRFCNQQFSSDFISSLSSINEAKSFFRDTFMIFLYCLRQNWRSARRSAITVDFNQPISWLNSPLEINVFPNRVWHWDTILSFLPCGAVKIILLGFISTHRKFQAWNGSSTDSFTLAKKPKACRRCTLSLSTGVISSFEDAIIRMSSKKYYQTYNLLPQQRYWNLY